LSDLSRAAAEFIVELAETAVTERTIFTLALSGGSTPRLLYEYLAKEEFSQRMPWEHTHIFWGDERCVSPDHPDSNFAMAFETLISKAPLPSENVHRVTTEGELPKAAAREYEKSLREFFQDTAHARVPLAFPSFDLILLGLGKDGHTASLFPGEPVLEEKIRWVVAVAGTSASPAVPRVTLTFPVINQARCVLFLASGSDKRDVFQKILGSPESAAQHYPAARVRPSGSLLWFIDEGLA
jgi:6-phosphogluconolactonase